MAYQPYTHRTRGAEIQEKYPKGSFALDLRDFVLQEANFYLLNLPPFLLYIYIYMCVCLSPLQNTPKTKKRYIFHVSNMVLLFFLCILLMIFLILYMLAVQTYYSALYSDYYL